MLIITVLFFNEKQFLIGGIKFRRIKQRHLMNMVGGIILEIVMKKFFLAMVAHGEYILD